MAKPRLQFLCTFPVVVLMLTCSLSWNFAAEAWGTDGHHVICNVAQALLTELARESVEELLPDNADGDLFKVCDWADGIMLHKGYEWSAPLHFIDTPNGECNYEYIRDCRDNIVKPGFCASGAINNYTTQMDTYSGQRELTITYLNDCKPRPSIPSMEDNLTEALMFLAHFVADIHQPLHVGFEGDHGGSSIPVYWYNIKSNLHHVWDTDMITEAKMVLFDGDISGLTKALLKNITRLEMLPSGEYVHGVQHVKFRGYTNKTVWKAEATTWSRCGGGEIACPDEYAMESIKLACEWAYPHTKRGGSLSDAYFLSRVPILQKRMAQSAVRLAAILNGIYTDA